jgi:hypothetical protein
LTATGRCTPAICGRWAIRGASDPPKSPILGKPFL